MPTYNVRLAEVPTAVVLALHAAAPLDWNVLRDEHGASSADMNLLVDLGFVTRDVDGWHLTQVGRAAVKVTPDA